jgi:hypothetical protein
MEGLCPSRQIQGPVIKIGQHLVLLQNRWPAPSISERNSMAIYRVTRDDDTRFVIAVGMEEAISKFIHKTECSDEITEITLVAYSDEVVE